MCGRFWQGEFGEYLRERFKVDAMPEEPKRSFNIAPSSQIGILRVQNDARELVNMRWGLIPHWAKDEKIGNKMINARAETITEKPSFRTLIRDRRCLIPCSGFYEWQAGPSGKTPYAIRMKDSKPFTMAGIWTSWTSPAGVTVLSFAIVTTEANELMQPIHHRMPVIIPAPKRARWLDPDVKDLGQILPLLKPYDSTKMEAFPVSRRVNRPDEDEPELLRRMG